MSIIVFSGGQGWEADGVEGEGDREGRERAGEGRVRKKGRKNEKSSTSLHTFSKSHRDLIRCYIPIHPLCLPEIDIFVPISYCHAHSSVENKNLYFVNISQMIDR